MLRVDYLAVPGLPTLSFEVAAGECLAVEGPSGSGKTRMLRAIADLDPAGGYVHLDGVERGEMRGPEWRRHVRYASAEPAWWAATGREHFPRMQGSIGCFRPWRSMPLILTALSPSFRPASASVWG